MDILKVKGQGRLEGTVRAAGAKNAMTKLLVASLLSDKKCIFYNVPNIGDVEITVNLCREIGSEVQWDREGGIIEIITRELKSSYIPQRFSGANRIPGAYPRGFHSPGRGRGALRLYFHPKRREPPSRRQSRL